MPGDNIIPMACIHCGRTNEIHDSATDTAPPSDGDPGICWDCGQIAVFCNTAFGLGQRFATEAEMEMFLADERVQYALEMVGRRMDPVSLVTDMRERFSDG